MAKALACDICGEFFKENDKIPNAINIGWTGNWLDTRHKEEYYEVCPECMKNIHGLINTIKSKSEVTNDN